MHGYRTRIVARRKLLHFFAGAGLWLAAVGGYAAAPKDESHEFPITLPQPALLHQVATVSRFPGVNNLDKPLVKILDELSNLGELGCIILIDHAAFRRAGVTDPEGLKLAAKIPRMAEANLDQVLQAIVYRIPVPGGAAYLMGRDYIAITTRDELRAEFSKVWFTLRYHARRVRQIFVCNLDLVVLGPEILADDFRGVLMGTTYLHRLSRQLHQLSFAEMKRSRD